MALALSWASGTAGTQAPHYRVEVVAVYPHDPGAFTQGLLWDGGFLYESIGLHGKSALRRVALETGKVLDQYRLADSYFAEGLARVDDRLIQLTWKAGRGFVYDLQALRQVEHFSYAGEGWGLAYDGQRLIQSDGSAVLHFRDPVTYREIARVQVTYQGQPIPRLNELEMVSGQLWANVWGTDLIVRIDPASGQVVGIIHAGSLREKLPAGFKAGVLNGIAFDPEKNRLFLTGKHWPRLFEVRVIKSGSE